MNNLFMVISILGGLASLILTAGLLISLFVKRLKPSRKKLTIALVISVILCVVGGALYEISPEDKVRMAQEAEAKKVAKAKAKEEKEKAEKEQKAQAKKEKEDREKKKGTKVEIVNYDTCTSQNRFCDRGGFHDGAFDALRVGMNPEEVTLKLERNAKGASIEYIKDKSGNYVEVIQYHFESAWYFVDASFKDGKLYYAERNEIKESKDKKEERRILDGRE